MDREGFRVIEHEQEDLRTESGVIAFMKTSRSKQDWAHNCDKVVLANNNAFPAFWFDKDTIPQIFKEVSRNFKDDDDTDSIEALRMIQDGEVGY